ncbi:MAG: polysaccharide biosynthesis tyrosine autokinase [Opitutaceae bacterium]
MSYIQNSRPPGPDGYAYPGDPYTSGYGSGEENPLYRTVRQAVATIRERIWYIITVFVVVSVATVVYTLSRTKIYTAAASIEILPREAVVLKVQEVRDSDLRGPEDLNTQVKLLESASIVQQVASRLTPDETKALLAPFPPSGDGIPMTAAGVLAMNRRVMPVRQTRILQMVFSHPDGEVAAKMANYFVEEFMNYNSRWRVDESMRAVEELKIRAEQQGKRVQDLANALQQYKERENLVSLDKRKDIVTEKLMSLNGRLSQANARLSEAERRWNQVQAAEANKSSLAELDFIGNSGPVQSLVQRVASERIAVAELQRRYRAKHPKMEQAVQSLAQTESELVLALASAAASVRNDFESARQAAQQAKAELQAQESESLKTDRVAVDYTALANELAVNENLLTAIQARMRETSMSATIETRNVRVVDRAGNPGVHSSPNIPMNLAMGGLAGLGLGLALAFGIAFMDDRVKSAYQVESVVGIPLIGVVPSLSKVDPKDRAQCVVSAEQPLAAEAFRTLHSGFRLMTKETPTQVVMITSTLPGEGKSLIATNLALTFAEHGERTLLIDADLRKPNVHRSLGLPNRAGLIECCTHDVKFDEAVIRGFRRNLDILPAGAKAVVPTHVFNDPRFGALIKELRSEYTRIVIDSPPLGPVSDALVVLPHADGSLLVVRFNRATTAGVKLTAKRLLDSKVACFGAVLNGLDFSLSDYYYAGHYGKSSHDYLLSQDKPGASA